MDRPKVEVVYSGEIDARDHAISGRGLWRDKWTALSGPLSKVVLLNRRPSPANNRGPFYSRLKIPTDENHRFRFPIVVELSTVT